MARMFKKDYIFIATALKELRQSHWDAEVPAVVHACLAEVVVRLADYFEDDNPKFNRAKFIDFISKTVE